MRTRKTVLLILFIVSTVMVSAQGVLQGTIIDKKTKEPLIAATIMVEGISKGTACDIDGNYSITSIPAGTYTVNVQYVSYSKQSIENVIIENNKTTRLDIEMVEAEIQLEGVQVVGVRRTNTDISILSNIKKAQLVVSGISSQQISRSLDRDAGEVVKRVPGVTIIDNRFVVVRGLSQRYNNVWINNVSTPSSEADSRAFSFDVIPGGLIDNLMIYKTPAPEIPADFSGGFVKILTKNVPDENGFNISLTTSYQQGSTFKEFVSFSRSGADLLGMGSLSRQLPGGFPGKIKSSMSQGEIAEQTLAVNKGWSSKTFSALPDIRLSATLTRKFKFEDVSAGMITALNYSNTYRYTDIDNNRYGIYQADLDRPFANNDYSDSQYQQDSKIGLLHNWSFVFSPEFRLEFRNFLNQTGRNRYTYREGLERKSENYTIKSSEIMYNSRLTYSGQISGKHTFENSDLDWVGGYSYANRNEPDRKIIASRLQDNADAPGFGSYLTDANDVKRYFQNLDEHVVSLGLNYERKLDLNFSVADLKAGVFSEYKNRIFKARNFAYNFNASVLPADFVFRSYDKMFTDEYIKNGGVLIKENTNKSDSYDANNLLNAAYLGLNLPLGEKVKIYAGVRVENNILKLNGYEADGTKPVNIDRSGFDLFPSVNATYNLNDKNLIRLAYGNSVNRPEFREIAPYVYYDFEQFSEFVGNESLKDAFIQNIDLRYELYPTPAETFSVSLFYKKFKNPIETTYLSTSSGQKYTYRNAESADNFGIELDIRKSLAFIGINDLSLVANASLISSRVRFTEGSWERNRAMQGQSPYLVNAGLYYDNDKNGIKGSVLYNRVGKRIVFLGLVYQDISQDIPDIYEMPFNSLDISFSKKIGKKLDLGVGIKNFLDETVQFKQFPEYQNASGDIQEREQITRSFKQGRNISISIRADI